MHGAEVNSVSSLPMSIEPTEPRHGIYGPPDLSKVMAVICQHFPVSEEEVLYPAKGSSRRSPARPLAMYLCYHVGKMPHDEIAGLFDLGSTHAAETIIRRMGDKIKQDTGLSEIYDCVLEDLNKP